MYTGNWIWWQRVLSSFVAYDYPGMLLSQCFNQKKSLFHNTGLISYIKTYDARESTCKLTDK
jgi:hypothetical protein